MLWLNLIPLCNGKTPTDFREARISWLRLCLCLILYMCVQENLILKEKQNKTKLLRKELFLGYSFKKGVGGWGYEQRLELKSTGRYVIIVPADTQFFFFFFSLEVTRTNIRCFNSTFIVNHRALYLGGSVFKESIHEHIFNYLLKHQICFSNIADFKDSIELLQTRMKPSQKNMKWICKGTRWAVWKALIENLSCAWLRQKFWHKHQHSIGLYACEIFTTSPKDKKG